MYEFHALLPSVLPGVELNEQQNSCFLLTCFFQQSLVAYVTWLVEKKNQMQSSKNMAFLFIYPVYLTKVILEFEKCLI